MGKSKRMRPKYLGEKLQAIRQYFDCTLEQMAEKLSNEEFSIRRQAVSQYELNQNEPPLPVLLSYARMAKITIDVLADDKIQLSDHFPNRKKKKNPAKNLLPPA